MFDDKKKRRLNNINDIKRYLARLINEANSQILSDAKVKQFRAITYALNVLNDVIRNHDIEKKLKKLEESIKNE